MLVFHRTYSPLIEPGYQDHLCKYPGSNKLWAAISSTLALPPLTIVSQLCVQYFVLFLCILFYFMTCPECKRPGTGSRIILPDSVSRKSSFLGL